MEPSDTSEGNGGARPRESSEAVREIHDAVDALMAAVTAVLERPEALGQAFAASGARLRAALRRHQASLDELELLDDVQKGFAASVLTPLEKALAAASLELLRASVLIERDAGNVLPN